MKYWLGIARCPLLNTLIGYLLLHWLYYYKPFEPDTRESHPE